MKHPLYRQALSYGWQLTKSHIHLWPFGLFAALLGQFGVLELVTRLFTASANYTLYPSWLRLPALFQAMAIEMPFSLSTVGMFAWFIVVLLGVFLVGTFVSVVSQGALVHAAAKHVKRKALLPSTTSWHAGVDHFWKVLALNAMRKIGLVALAVLVGWGTLNVVQDYTAMDAILFLTVFVLATLVGMIITFLTMYAVGYVVVEEYSIGDALRGAWKMMKDHWLVSLEVGVLLLALNALVTLLAVVLVSILLIPLFISNVFAAITGNALLLVVGTSIFVIAAAVIVAGIGALFTVYTTSVWTFLFMKMHSHGITSRLLHALSRGKISFGH